MQISPRSTRLMKALLPIPIAAVIAALLLLSGCTGAASQAEPVGKAQSQQVQPASRCSTEQRFVVGRQSGVGTYLHFRAR